jgi:hypothetical protein
MARLSRMITGYRKRTERAEGFDGLFDHMPVE